MIRVGSKEWDGRVGDIGYFEWFKAEDTVDISDKGKSTWTLDLQGSRVTKERQTDHSENRRRM